MKSKHDRTKFFLVVFFATALSLLFFSCQTPYDFFRASPSTVITDFLPDRAKLQDQKVDFPFRKMWIDKEFDWKDHKEIIVAPVKTDKLLGQSWWDRMNMEKVLSDPKKDCETIAKYMDTSFKLAIGSDTNKRFRIVSKSEHNTLILELNLIELVPTKAFLNATENVVAFIFWPAQFLMVVNSGSVAMEGKIIDANTGKVVCMFTDRETDSFAFIDLAGMTWFKHAELIMDGWSKDFVKVMNSKDPFDVKMDLPVKIIEF